MSTYKTFLEIAPRYIANRQVSRQYAAGVLRVAQAVGTISVERVNQYLLSRIETVSGLTVKTERTICLCLWRWAFDAGLVDHAPRGVMKMKAKRKPTRAWTIPQIRQIVTATATLNGKRMRSGADLGKFLRCWVLVAYESGARFGDVMAFRRDSVNDDTLAWTQSKTGDPMVRTLTPACLDAIDAMLEISPDGRILGWACNKRQAMRHMRDLLKSVGMDGTSKWLRRSGATHCEMERAGAGRLHLGHRSPALFESAYADWSQLRTRTPRTPAIV